MLAKTSRMICPHGRATKSGFAWMHSDGKICDALMGRGGYKTRDWKTSRLDLTKVTEGVDLDKVKFTDPEVIAQLCTEEGTTALCVWLADPSKNARNPDGSMNEAALEETVRRVAKVVSCIWLWQMVGETLVAALPNWRQNADFVAQRMFNVSSGNVHFLWHRFVYPSRIYRERSIQMIDVRFYLTEQVVGRVSAELGARQKEIDNAISSM